jgi:hypothetical protein
MKEYVLEQFMDVGGRCGSGSKNQMAGIASAGSWYAARRRMRSFYRFAQDREAP